MSVPVNIPEITVLRSRVEEKYGRMLETHNGFIALVSDKSTTPFSYPPHWAA